MLHYALVPWADLEVYFLGDLSCLYHLKTDGLCFKVNRHFILVRFDLLAITTIGLLIRASVVLDLRGYQLFADAHAPNNQRYFI